MSCANSRFGLIMKITAPPHRLTVISERLSCARLLLATPASGDTLWMTGEPRERSNIHLLSSCCLATSDTFSNRHASGFEMTWSFHSPPWWAGPCRHTTWFIATNFYDVSTVNIELSIPRSAWNKQTSPPDLRMNSDRF